jgi:hypothetical protein
MLTAFSAVLKWDLTGSEPGYRIRMHGAGQKNAGQKYNQSNDYVNCYDIFGSTKVHRIMVLDFFGY